jgi:hypothetical protein
MKRILINRDCLFLPGLAICMAFCSIARTAAAELEPLDGWNLPPGEKVVIFEKQLHETNDIDGMILSEVDVTTNPDGTKLTEPMYEDSDYWTGNYLVGESLRYAVTGSAEAKENCERSVRALIRLARITGVPGVIARGYVDASMSDKYYLHETDMIKKTPDGARYINLDASVDQLIGAMQGFHFVYRYVADEQLKKEIAEVVSEICDGLIDNNYKLLDIDGKPTTWGVFTPGEIPSDLHAFLILAVFKIGAYITGNRRYEEAYQFLRVESSYGLHSRTAKFPAAQNSSDDAMEFAGYLNMLMVENDPAARADYLASMKRSWKIVKYYDKAYINLIVLHSFDGMPDRQKTIERALEQLRIFPTEKIRRTVDFCSFNRPDKRYPNPANFRPVEYYYWIADTFVCSERSEPDLKVIGAGVDYIMIYWMARYWGFLKE